LTVNAIASKAEPDSHFSLPRKRPHLCPSS